jgi:hypothetical protein
VLRGGEESSRRKVEEESAGEGSMDWRCVAESCESCAFRASILAVAALILAGAVVVGLLGVVMGWHDGCQRSANRHRGACLHFFWACDLIGFRA